MSDHSQTKNYVQNFLSPNAFLVPRPVAGGGWGICAAWEDTKVNPKRTYCGPVLEIYQLEGHMLRSLTALNAERHVPYEMLFRVEKDAAPGSVIVIKAAPYEIVGSIPCSSVELWKVSVSCEGISYTLGVYSSEGEADEIVKKLKQGSMQREAIKRIFRELRKSYGLCPYEEDGKECGFEFEDWTPNGVDMPAFADLRGKSAHDPYCIVDELESYAEDFDVDEEVRTHMEADDFRKAFSYLEAAEEFTNWKEILQETATIAKETLAAFAEESGLRREDCVEIGAIRFTDILKEIDAEVT